MTEPGKVYLLNTDRVHLVLTSPLVFDTDQDYPLRGLFLGHRRSHSGLYIGRFSAWAALGGYGIAFFMRWRLKQWMNALDAELDRMAR